MLSGHARPPMGPPRLRPRTREAGSALRRALFTRDPAGTWKPDGFEVQVVGPSGARKVWIHLVVASHATRGRTAVQPNTLILPARDP